MTHYRFPSQRQTLRACVITDLVMARVLDRLPMADAAAVALQDRVLTWIESHVMKRDA